MAVPQSNPATPGALKPRHDGLHDLGVINRRNNKYGNLVGQAVERDPDSPVKKKVAMGSEYMAIMSVLRNCWMMGPLCFMVLVVSLSSSIFSTAMVLTATEFGASAQHMLLGLTLYIVGIACGAPVFGRMAKPYGCRELLVAAMVMFVLCHVVVGFATDLQAVFFGRYFSGFFGSAPVVIAPSIASQFEPLERTIAIAVYATALSSGPLLGVIFGEFSLLVPSSTWHWTIWVAAAAGVISICLTLVAVAPEKQSPPNRVMRDAQNQLPPFPPRALAAVCASLIYGLLHMTLLVYPMSFEIDRAFPFGISSLPFLAVLVGLIIGCGSLVRRAMQLRPNKSTKAWTAGIQEQLSFLSSGCCTLTLGLFMFAWTSSREVSPWPQISSGLLIGYGVITVIAPAIIYLVETSSANTSTISSYIFMQSIVASVSPLLVIPLYKRLGVQLASSVLATVCLIVAIVLLFAYKRVKE